MGAPEAGGTAQLGRALPTGTVTFLFTDIEGSTKLLQHLGEAYGPVLAEHRRLLSEAFEAHGGVEVHSEGDGGLVAFARAGDAIEGAIRAQQLIASHPWPEEGGLRVRMGIHTGEAVLVSGDYVGLAVHQAARICAAGHGGQVLVSQATRELALGGLARDAVLLDLGEYRLKDVEGPERLYQVVHPGLASAFPPPRVLNVLPNNLPANLTSFVGRTRELAEVRRLLDATRLLTLRGAGGSGKTRLALEVAHHAIEAFGDGVWFVDLAPVNDAGLVPQRVAAAIGLREEPGRDLTDTLLDRLRRNQVLLLLDNCEHVLDASSDLVVKLLRACPELRVIATSREPLGVPGETTWLLPMMNVPDRDDLTQEELEGFDAVRLFIDRAGQVRPGFSLGREDVEHVAMICRELDGIPLAIELAAARIRVLTPQQLAGRLGDRFRLLTGSDRTAEARHQTLRATVDWSYDLLTERERTLFRRIAVFAGSWTLDAAEGVCADEELDEADVLETLTALVDKSLVFTSRDGSSTTYRMLETVRLYGVERLGEAGESEEVGARFRRWYLDLAERTARHLSGPDQAARMDVLEAEHDNLQAALGGAVEAGDGETALRMSSALAWFWAARGHLTEGRTWLASALAAGPEPSIARARALGEAGRLTEAQSDYKAARNLYEESLDIAERLGDEVVAAERLANLGNIDWLEGSYADSGTRLTRALEMAERNGARLLVARCMNSLGALAFMQGDRAAARERFNDALALRREIDDAQGVAETLNNLGIIARIEGELEGARALTEESLSIVRALGHRPLVAAFAGNLGIALQREGRFREARAMFEESLSIRRELGDKDGVAIVLNSVGNAAYLQGDPATALPAYEESLALRRELGDRRGTAETLANLGVVLRLLGSPDTSREHYVESLEIRRELGDRSGIAGSLHGLAMIAHREEDADRCLALLREALGEANAAGDRGRAAEILESFVEVLSQSDPQRAAMVAGAVQAIPEQVRGPGREGGREEAAQVIARVRESLGDQEFKAALDRGAELDADQLVELVGSEPNLLGDKP